MTNVETPQNLRLLTEPHWTVELSNSQNYMTNGETPKNHRLLTEPHWTVGLSNSQNSMTNIKKTSQDHRLMAEPHWTCMESKKTTHGRNTLTLFEEYLKKKNNSVKALKDALEAMARPDALQVLLDAMPEIEQKYKIDLQKRHMKLEPTQHDEDMSYTHMSHHHPSMYPSMANGHSHVGHRMGMPGYHPPMYNQMNITCQPYSATSYSNMDIDIGSTPSSSASTMHQIKEINITHNYQRPAHQHPNHTHTHIQQGVIRYSHPPTNIHHTGMSTAQSMAVNVDNRDNYTRDDVEMTDVGRSIIHREDPQPLPQAILRNQNHYIASLNRVPRLLNPNDMNVDREEEVVSSNCMEPPTCSHAPLGRKISDESNARQPLTEPRCQNKKLALNISAAPIRTQMTNGHEFVSPSPTQTPTQSPLDKLQQITGSEIYMPDEKYKNMIDQKNREELMYNRCGNEGFQRRRSDQRGAAGGGSSSSKENANSNDWFNFHPRNPTSNISASQSSDLVGKTAAVGKDQVVKTFPLRAKSMLACQSPESPKEKSPTLTKSQSMPCDMKPAEYKKAFRYIKAFVTYAAESKRHIQRVLNMCRCLEKNGFTCCMDMYDRRMPTEDKEGWVEQRFQEADFILLCVSQRYIEETEFYEEKEEVMPDSQLHTAQIYRLMLDEYRQNGRNRRFIPIMVDGTGEEHIPEWLQNTLHYRWPNHFRDLMWFLTKPETRIKIRQQSSSASDQSTPSPQSPKSPTSEN
ncbi:hypothetical protein FSP39_009271 [Pinctada imbricata]|uniref:SEFIR domain-containing protein n=1 Tax=Pinctada imbricata TaxID=66713 RepID=A0AA89C5R7_PINIB|nr:hypothetical protein FSP39_009271 [Pinctada imbricata]